MFPFSFGLGDDCAAISSTGKAVVSLVEAVLQEFPNGCGRAGIEDRIQPNLSHVKLRYTLLSYLMFEGHSGIPNFQALQVG